MSSRNKDGSWTMPQEQVEEFLHSRIDYNKLVRECLKSPTKSLNRQATFGRYVPQAVQEIELDVTVEVGQSSLVRFLNKRIF